MRLYSAIEVASSEWPFSASREEHPDTRQNDFTHAHTRAVVRPTHVETVYNIHQLYTSSLSCVDVS